MSKRIEDVFPSPSKLLALPIEEVANIVLKYAYESPENQKGHLNRYNFTLKEKWSSYAGGHDVRKVSEIIMEAWMLLENEGLLAPSPGMQGEWRFVTSKGANALHNVKTVGTRSIISKTSAPFRIKNESLPQKPRNEEKAQYTCFVIMPIGEKGTNEYNENMKVYNNIIKKAVLGSGYNIYCYHAELINDPGAIHNQIINSLENDDIVIADIRRNNPNVIWELGVRHAFMRRSIMVFSDPKEAFFDTSSYRIARYNINNKSNITFCHKIHQFVNHVLQEPDFPDNPVWTVKSNKPIKASLNGTFSAANFTEIEEDILFSIANTENMVMLDNELRNNITKKGEISTAVYNINKKKLFKKKLIYEKIDSYFNSEIGLEENGLDALEAIIEDRDNEDRK